MDKLTEYLSFSELKQKVGVEDVAFALGFRIDKRAGIGSWFEMRLNNDAGQKIDGIVVKNVKDKSRQTFYNRSGMRGDVVTFIRNNLSSFNVTGKDDWEKVNKVLYKFANEPLPNIRQQVGRYQAGSGEKEVFDPSRFEVLPVTGGVEQSMSFFMARGLTEDTVRQFAPFLERVRDTKSRYPYYNLGFPYRLPGKDETLGYELRGRDGFKGMAKGTDKASAAWIADFSPNNAYALNVFFFESGFDAMAFYQANKGKIDLQSSVFVSTGGSFSEKQIKSIMDYYHVARAYDCFDNDVPGKIYGIKMAGLLEGINMGVIHNKDKGTVEVAARGKIYQYDASKISLSRVSQDLSLRYKVSSWKAPEAYKDWNDVILGKRMEPEVMKTKFQRDENLAEKRGRGL